MYVLFLQVPTSVGQIGSIKAYTKGEPTSLSTIEEPWPYLGDDVIGNGVYLGGNSKHLRCVLRTLLLNEYNLFLFGYRHFFSCFMEISCNLITFILM